MVIIVRATKLKLHLPRLGVEPSIQTEPPTRPQVGLYTKVKYDLLHNINLCIKFCFKFCLDNARKKLKKKTKKKTSKPEELRMKVLNFLEINELTAK